MKIESIYRKFKSYIYFDKTSLHIKELINNFEIDDEVNLNLSLLSDVINEICVGELSDESISLTSKWLKEIDFYVIPKNFKEDVEVDEDTNVYDQYTSNTFSEDNIVVDKLNFLFKGSIELHLIVFFWVLKYSKYLEKIYYEHNYANRLVDYKSSLEDNSNRTFRPYFSDYAMWRDTGIRKAQELNEKGEGCAILMLDICSYYYNVNFDFSNLIDLMRNNLTDEEFTEYLYLTEFIERIFIKYNTKLKRVNKIIQTSQNSLPLGLSISPILANYYLHEFDKNVTSTVKPVYYGRYVDDIMIVLNENSFKYLSRNKSTQEFIQKNFIETIEILKYDNGKYIINDAGPTIKYDDRIAIQTDKIKLYVLEKNGTKALLEKFVDNIRKNSSEFRFIPEEGEVIHEFFAEAYAMLYSDTQNKLRSISEFKGDKFGVSKYLAKIIHTSKYWNDDAESLDKLVDQVDNFFVGRYCLEYYNLWEKIFAFYIINQRYEYVIKFYKRIKKQIDKLVVESVHNKSHSKLCAYLSEYCDLSLSCAGAINYNVFDRFDKKIASNNREMAKLFRNANMFNHNYLIMPLINYTNGAYEISNLMDLSYRCKNDCIPGRERCKAECNFCDMVIDEDSNKIKFSPRFIHFHEIQHYLAYLDIYKSEGTFDEAYLIKSEHLFTTFNQINNENAIFKFPNIEKTETDPNIVVIQVPSGHKQNVLKVGVASIKVESNNIERSYLKKPNLSRSRLNSIIKLLNYIESTHSDIVVLPEVSIPFSWMGIFTQYAQKRQKTLVFGLEHIINRNSFAFNILVTIIPFKSMNINNCLVRLRLKNYYSPEESRLLKGYRYNLPQNEKAHYDIFKWNGVRFSCFNCFELADIRDRSYFKSKVDFLTASEYNRDTNYFSNIVESVSRDIHCYFIQSNSSDFGDSRITSPSKSYKMDIVRLKGGINDQIVVGEINIKKLREFQYKEFELQKDDDSFKPTPPNYDKTEIEKILAD